MSYIGKNPKIDSIIVEPQSVEPVNPTDGEIYYDDGTNRSAGPYIWQGGAWQAIGTSGVSGVLASLTLTPQSADPGSPVIGMFFNSDGTSREEGVWYYDGANWVPVLGYTEKEFQHEDYYVVRVATTGAGALASSFENGDTVDGVVLATNDIILIKNQATLSENGVYVVQSSGAPVRDTNYNTFDELNNAAVFVSEGTTNRRTRWFQTAILANISDPQTWSSTPNTFSFTVPGGITSIIAEICPAGGGGGGGAGANGSGGGGGGSGGEGGISSTQIIPTTPGDVLTITVGIGGAGAVRVSSAGVNGNNGSDGGDCIIAGASHTITVKGGRGGLGGLTGAGAGGSARTSSWSPYTPNSSSGNGGNGTLSGTTGTAGNGSNSCFASGGSGGTTLTSGSPRGGPGGGGGAGREGGGNGGNASSSAQGNNGTDVYNNIGAGGGGGSGSAGASGGIFAGQGGIGGNGYIKLKW